MNKPGSSSRKSDSAGESDDEPVEEERSGGKKSSTPSSNSTRHPSASHSTPRSGDGESFTSKNDSTTSPKHGSTKRYKAADSSNKSSSSNGDGGSSSPVSSVSSSSASQISPRKIIDLSPSTDFEPELAIPSWPQLPRGLNNLGYTCFVNSVLSVLLNTHPLAKYFLFCQYDWRFRQNAVIMSFARLFHAMWVSPTPLGPVRPVEFLNNAAQMNYEVSTGQQQDAHVFFSWIVSYCDEHLARRIAADDLRRAGIRDLQPIPIPGISMTAKEKENLDPVRKTYSSSVFGDLLGGKLLSTTRCGKCKTCFSHIDSFFDVSLSIPNKDLMTQIDDHIIKHDGGSGGGSGGGGAEDSLDDDLEALDNSNNEFIGYNREGKLENGGDSDVDDEIDYTHVDPSSQSPFAFVENERQMAIKNQSWSARLLHWASIKRACVTLSDCLRGMISGEKMVPTSGKDKKSNGYKCELCKQVVLCERYSAFIEEYLPEILTFHFKRFRYGKLLKSTKIGTHVSCPLTGLDMRPYCVSSTELASRLRDVLDIEHFNESDKNTFPPPPLAPPLYSLFGIIRHLGPTISRGHYIAYILGKAEDSSDCWFCVNDRSVSRVSTPDISKVEAYMAFYARETSLHLEKTRSRLLSIVLNKMRQQEMRMNMNMMSNVPVPHFWFLSLFSTSSPQVPRMSGYICKHGMVSPVSSTFRFPIRIVSSSSSSSSSLIPVITWPWVMVDRKFIDAVEGEWPGLILHGLEKCVLMHRHLNEGVMMEMEMDDNENDDDDDDDRLTRALNYLNSRNVLSICSICTQDLQKRKRAEKKHIQSIDTKSVSSTTSTSSSSSSTLWFLISANWLRSWVSFRDNPQSIPPGPICNDQLLNCVTSSPVKGLKLSADYRGVNIDVWRAFHKRYGGGPAIVRKKLDIYSPAVRVDWRET